MDTSALFFNFVALSFRRSARPEVIHVKEMLGKKNFTSPLVAQFAIKSKETFVLSETFKEHINGLQKKFEELKKHSRGLCHGAEDLISKYSEAMNLISK